MADEFLERLAQVDEFVAEAQRRLAGRYTSHAQYDATVKRWALERLADMPCHMAKMALLVVVPQMLIAQGDIELSGEVVDQAIRARLQDGA